MQNPRTYGNPPCTVAVVHGGPGAGGEMAPVARELAGAWGVLEPLQTARSLDGQVEELRDVLERHAATPIILLGYSWGAWLSCIVAARYPALVQRLVLVGSGPFDAAYVPQLEDTRRSRLTPDEATETATLIAALGDPSRNDKHELLARLGALSASTDLYDPLPAQPDSAATVEHDGTVFHHVWREAATLRQSGELLRLAQNLRCPVIAIHGDYDPHPAEGVRGPLSAVLTDFTFIMLERCGHTPWLERQARDQFFAVVRNALT
jgi:pimeloyl-ACP methyl ester carboxylesterase